MKRLIVLIAMATLLASLSGCCIFRSRRAQTCDTTSPAPIRLRRLPTPSLSLPWRRGANGIGAEECAECNQEIGGVIRGGVISGEVINGGVISSSIPTESLYQPDTVYEGPIYESQPLPNGSIISSP